MTQTHTGGRPQAESITAGDEELAILAKAIGHPARVAILRLLTRHGECICGRIVSVLPRSQATISQHLKVLKEAGLVQGEVNGPRVCYCVNRQVVERLQRLVAGLCSTPKKGDEP